MEGKLIISNGTEEKAIDLSEMLEPGSESRHGLIIEGSNGQEINITRERENFTVKFSNPVLKFDKE
jgi:hypothetical protein